MSDERHPGAKEIDDNVTACRQILKAMSNKDVAEIAGIAQVHRELMATATLSEIAGAITVLTKVLDAKLDALIEHSKTVEGVLKDICGKMPDPGQ